MQNFPNVKDILPHRAPFLFVDRICACDEKSITAELFLDASLPFFAGHFPSKPIMPGVLIAESLAQTSGLFLAVSSGKTQSGEIFYLASNNIKYIEVVHAGETLLLKSELNRGFNGLYSFSVRAFVGGRAVAEGSLVLAAARNVK